MKYWLIYNDGNEIVGYSTYKQFDGQTSTDEIPERFKDKENKKKKKQEGASTLYNTTDQVLQYLEEVACGMKTTLRPQEFLEMCSERQKARDKIKDND